MVVVLCCRCRDDVETGRETGEIEGDSKGGRERDGEMGDGCAREAREIERETVERERTGERESERDSGRRVAA